MISRVSASYQFSSAEDPAQAYNLVNVIESETQCVDNLQLADPCQFPLTYFPGTTSPLAAGDVAYEAAALFANNMLYVFNTGTITQLFCYDYTTGETSNACYASDTSSITSSLAVDKNGIPIYMRPSSFTNTIIVCRSFTGDSTWDTIDFDTGLNYNPTILNDNLYNIYLIENNTLVALDVYTVPAVSTILFNVTEGDTILYAAVYHDGVSPTLALCTFTHLIICKIPA
jgi:hypothetical protein